MTIQEIMNHNDRIGHHFFSPDTLRFFKSRIGSMVYGNESRGYYFITSEQFDYKSPRLYTIRKYDHLTGRIKTVGDFQQYKTQSKARTEIKKLTGE